MKIQQFRIEFLDSKINPQSVYRPGQSISFLVNLSVEKPFKCKNIEVTLGGSSEVHFSKGSRRDSEFYASEEVYIDDTKIVFVPSETGPDTGRHPMGEFNYRFCFDLPSSAPSSLEAGVGRIRYGIQVTINRSIKSDKSIVKYFTVVRDLDLNQQPSRLTGPFVADEDDPQSVFMDADCCCYICNCYRCGKVFAKTLLDRRGFVPGDNVVVRGEIRNGACVNLTKIELQIFQETTCLANGIRKRIPRIASSLELSGVARGDSLMLDHLLHVPPTVSSFVEGCNNIEVHYFLRLLAHNCGCEIGFINCCELIIGTVPMRSALQCTVEADLPPPPSYAECVFGKVKMDPPPMEGDQGVVGSSRDIEWAPSYPVYLSNSG